MFTFLRPHFWWRPIHIFHRNQTVSKRFQVLIRTIYDNNNKEIYLVWQVQDSSHTKLTKLDKNKSAGSAEAMQE